MAVADLLNKITEDATAECESVLDEAKAEVKKIEEATEVRIAELQKQSEQDTAVLLDTTRRKVESTAEREGKLKLEALKRQLLDEVFAVVSKKVNELDDSHYQSFLEKQLGNLPEGVKGTAVIPAERTAVTKKALKSAGVKVDEVEEANFTAGVILQGKDFEFDLSLERLLSELKAKKEMEIASELLSD